MPTLRTKVQGKHGTATNTIRKTCEPLNTYDKRKKISGDKNICLVDTPKKQDCQ